MKNLRRKTCIRLGRLTVPWYSAVFFLLLSAGGYGYTALIGILSALLHEAGHVIAALICGAGIDSITLYPCGADMKLTGHLRSYLADAFVSGAGAAVNILLTLLFFLLSGPAFTVSDGRRELLLGGAACNLSLALVNLLPVIGLDGGSLLKSILLIFLDSGTVYRATHVISFITLFAAWLAAVYILLVANGSVSLFMLVCVMFASVFLRGRE